MDRVNRRSPARAWRLGRYHIIILGDILGDHRIRPRVTVTVVSASLAGEPNPGHTPVLKLHPPSRSFGWKGLLMRVLEVKASDELHSCQGPDLHCRFVELGDSASAS